MLCSANQRTRTAPAPGVGDARKTNPRLQHNLERLHEVSDILARLEDIEGSQCLGILGAMSNIDAVVCTNLMPRLKDQSDSKDGAWWVLSRTPIGVREFTTRGRHISFP